MMNFREIGFFLAIVLILGFGIWSKFLAPNSATKSRFGGEPVKLEAPTDCAKILNMSKSKGHKYIIYVDNLGNVKMKEYSDWGLLQGEYIVTGYKDPDMVTKLVEEGSVK